MRFEDAMDKHAYEDGLVSGRAYDPSQYERYDVGGLSYYSWLAGFFDGRSEVNVKIRRHRLAERQARASQYYKDTVILKQEAAHD